MSDEKINGIHREHDLESNAGLRRTMTTVTLSPEQFEALYLQPKMGVRSSLLGKVGNGAPLAVTSFLIAQVPLSMDLMGFLGTDGDSGLTILGAFYLSAGLGLYLGAIFEWAVGNTFPMIVFGSFGGFWSTYAVLVQPTFRVAAAFAPANVTDTTFAGVTATAAGAATRSYNSGLSLYFIMWTILCFIYTIAALRTNVPFVIVFLSLIGALSSLAAAHFHTGVGELAKAAHEFKIAGGFGFVTGLAGLWIDISLILKAVDFPIEIPLLDLSHIRFMQPRATQLKERED